tara:strand:+ start:465 stop:1085 length:621 start_codon:yes stop_codon:yes gene_type:complete
MNYIKNIHNDIKSSYYKKIYDSFLLNNSDEKILIINQNYFNPLLMYSNYLKKYNINLYILFSDKNSIINMNNEVKYDECNNLIHYNIHDLKHLVLNYSNINFNKIILLHIKSIDYLKKNINIAAYFKTNLYIYISLSTKNKLLYKNQLRGLFSNNYGKVFDYDEILSLLNSLEYFNLDKINIINNEHYITYGSNKSYLFILKYKYT